MDRRAYIYYVLKIVPIVNSRHVGGAATSTYMSVVYPHQYPWESNIERKTELNLVNLKMKYKTLC